MTYSFPCTDLSLAGKRAGMDKGSGTRSGLLWEVERLLNEVDNLPQILIMENVPQVLTSNGWFEWVAFLESKGYSSYAEVLNAKNFGIPQNRERCFMVSILGNYNYKFPKGFELKYRLKDLLESNVDESYYLSDKIINYYYYYNSEKQKENGNGFRFSPTYGDCVAKTITTRAGSRMDDNFIGTFDYAQSDTLRETLERRIHINSDISWSILASGNQNGIIIGSTQKHAYVGSIDKESPSLTSAMGMGGGHIPMIIKNEIEPKVLGGIGEKKSNGGTQWYQQDRIYDNNVAISVTTSFQPNYLAENLRIRKLTPKECFKLMGVKPSDYEKITVSKSQKYKQAGNSIVTTCLMAIYSQLFNGVDYKKKIDELLEELIENVK